MDTAPPQVRPTLGQQVARRVVSTLVTWIAAYLIVTLVFLIGGDALNSAPAAVRGLVVSGVLVIIMVNILMPGLTKLFAKLLAPRRSTQD